jgi:hypothetical protein
MGGNLWRGHRVAALALVCLFCATGYLVSAHGSQAMGATAANVAPANDDFADAEPLVGAAGARSGATAGATLEAGENHFYLEQGSVWFRWKAPWSGWATFQTCGARFDTELEVYTGTSLLGLERVYSLDGACARGRASGADFKAEAGTVYLIAVGGFRGEGEFTLRWGRFLERTSTHGSCFFSTKGVLRWCLGRGANSWDPCQAAEVYQDGDRYFVSEGNTKLGYVRPAGPARWRAMVPVYRGWARGGAIVRASNGRWIISRRGRTLGFARGPYPIAVGAYRLLAGNC